MPAPGRGAQRGTPRTGAFRDRITTAEETIGSPSDFLAAVAHGAAMFAATA
ncbi:hypothetical protein [Streptomyces sp. NPDC001070]